MTTRGRYTRTVLWLLAAAVALTMTASTGVAAPASKAAQARAARVHEIGLRKAAVDPAFVRRHRSTYSVQVPKTPIGDQEHSGRCWAYAWTKTLQTMAKAQGCTQPDVLSAAFINYHALRALAYGEIDRAVRDGAHPEHGLAYLDGDMLGEGGYSHWANAIVKKYGIVPEEKLSSATFDSRWSDIMQNQLHRLVTAAYRDIDKTSTGANAKRRAIADKYKQKVDQALDTMIGAPPRQFTIHGKTYTPKTYLRDYLKLAENDLQFVNLSNDPGRAFNRRYRESYAGKGIPANETYNVSIDVIQRAVRKTVRAGIAPNVAVNVDWDNPHRVANRHDDASPQNGIMSVAAFKYEKLVPTVKLSKRDRMGANVSLSNHMMAITGYEPAKPGKQARYQIDNSHGKGSFRQGRLDMYDDFFKQYVEEVTVPRSALPKGLLKKLDEGPALDTVAGMSIAPSKGGEKWTPTRKRMLVKVLIREELSFADAAERYNLPPETVRSWYHQARTAMLQAFRSSK